MTINLPRWMLLLLFLIASASDEGNTCEAVTALFPNLESSVRRVEKTEPLNLDSFYLTYVMIQ